MEAYDLDTFKLLDRYRYLRSNFIAAYHGGSQQYRKRELGHTKKRGGLCGRGLLAKPVAQKKSKNYRYSPRVYELTDKSKAILEAHGVTPIKWDSTFDYFHRLMIADIVLSIEIACKKRGLRFRHRAELIGDAPLSFKSSINFQFPKRMEEYDGALQPDELFAINDTYFVLEADRGTEPISRFTFKTSSYMRKLLQYKYVLQKGTYKELIPNMIVLNITMSEQRAKHLKDFMYDDLQLKSSAICFHGNGALGSLDTYPDPLVYLLNEPLERAGFEPLIISKVVKTKE